MFFLINATLVRLLLTQNFLNSSVKNIFIKSIWNASEELLAFFEWLKWIVESVHWNEPVKMKLLRQAILCVSQGEKDWQKYETARRLKKCVERIRAQYREDWRSKEMRIRQRAVALYFIDKVSLHYTHSDCDHLFKSLHSKGICSSVKESFCKQKYNSESSLK